MPQLPFPFRVFVGPDKPVIGLAEAPNRVKLEVADIDFTLLTHLYWDHVGGLLELPVTVPVRSNGTVSCAGRSRPWASRAVHGVDSCRSARCLIF
jgi:glyoxylase-like metal-dependent hydrolase (beta-lactamase superfamily II)